VRAADSCFTREGLGTSQRPDGTQSLKCGRYFLRTNATQLLKMIEHTK
jgi:hypothetical protein